MATNTIKGIRKNAENANVTKFHCHAKQAKLDFNTRTHTHTHTSHRDAELRLRWHLKITNIQHTNYKTK